MGYKVLEVRVDSAAHLNIENKEHYIKILNDDSNLYSEEYKELKSVFEPRYEVVPYYIMNLYDSSESDEYNGKIYIEHITFYIHCNINNEIFILKPNKTKWNKQTYNFSLPKELNNTILKEFKYDVAQPNSVGKATDKKLHEWYMYLYQREEAKANYIKQFNNDKYAKIKAFHDRIKPISKFITWSQDKHSGEYIANGLKYSFEIGKDGCVYETIKYIGESNVENFLKYI